MKPQQPQILNTFRCNQSWNGMAPSANGRHCRSCKKEVRDFTGMPPEMILQVLEQHGGKMCGRIEASKVVYQPEPLYLKPVMIAKRSWWKIAAAASALYLALIGEARGQDENSGNSRTTHKQIYPTERTKKAEKEKTQALFRVQGKVTDALTGEELPFANFIVKQNGKQIGGGIADFDGIYVIQLSPYYLQGDIIDIEFSLPGFTNKVVTGVPVSIRNTRFLNVALMSSGASEGNKETEVLIFKEPLICPDQYYTNRNVKGQLEVRKYTKEEIQAMSTRETTSIGQVMVTSKQYYINGVKKAPEPYVFPDPGHRTISKDEIKNHPSRDIDSIVDQLKSFLLICAVTSVFLLLAGSTVAQEADSEKKNIYVLKGKVTDAETGVEIPFANVVLKHEGKRIGGAAADFEGLYEVNLTQPNLNEFQLYVEVSYIGYQKKIIKGVVISKDYIRRLNVTLFSEEQLENQKTISCGSDKEIFYYPEPGTRTYTREDFRRQFR